MGLAGQPAAAGAELDEKATRRPGFVGLGVLDASLRKNLCRRLVADVRAASSNRAR